MAIKFAITGDNNGFLTSMEGVRNSVRSTMQDVEDAGVGVEQMFDRLKKAAALSFAGLSAKELIHDIMDVRGKFQQLEVAFKTMLGSEQAATKLMDQLVKTAATTPFDLKGVADGAKMLLAYGTEVENVNEILVRLGDVAAGMSIQLSDLVYLYGTTMVQGRMFTQDLRQFQGRGIPIAEEIAKVLNVTKNQVPELVTAGKVTAEVFHQAFINMTNDGSKFGGLMKEQSKTIVGQISNIEDAVDMMFNDIGKQSEGAINAGLGAVSYLVENWQKVGEAIGVAAVAIGSYKAVMVAVNAIQRTNNALMAESAVQQALATAAGHALTAGQARQAAMEVMLTRVRQSLIVATKELAAATLLNPYVWAAAAITTLVVLTYKLATAEDAETIARRKANDEMQKFADGLDEQKNKIQSYIHTLQDETATEYDKAVAWEMLSKAAPTLTEKYSKAEVATMDLAQANRELNQQMNEETFDHLQKKVDEYREKVAALKKEVGDGTPSATALYQAKYGVHTHSKQDLEETQAMYDELVKRLTEMQRIRRQIAEDNKPLEIKIQEANDNVKAKEEIYKFYKKAADLAGQLKEAHDIAEGTISSTNIPTDYEKVADDVRRKYDDLISELESDVEKLRKQIAESPASLSLKDELEGKEKALQDLLNMKANWDYTGATTIHLFFKSHYDEAENELENARNNGKEGMYFNYVTDKYERSQNAVPTKTAAQWKADAYSKWKAAEKALDDYYKQKDEVDKETFDKKVEDLQADVDEAKKQYQKYGGSTSGKKGGSNDAAKRRAAALQEERRWQEEMDKLQRELEAMNEETRISFIANEAEREREERENQHKRALDQIAQQAEEMRKAVYEHNKKVWENQNKDGVYEDTEAGKAGWKDIELTKEQQDYLKALRDKENAEYTRHRIELQKEELQAMREYLKEYGTLQERKYAIEKQYNDKISNERSEWMKKTLEAEKKIALNNIDIEAMRTNIDWTMMFDGLSDAFQSQVRDAVDKIEAYMKTAEFKQLDATQKREYIDMRNSLNQKTGSKYGVFDFSVYKQIGQEMVELQNALRASKEAQNEHTMAVMMLNRADKDLKDAEEKLEKARGTEGQLVAQQNVNYQKAVLENAKKQFKKTGEKQKEAENNVVDAQGKLQKSVDDSRKTVDNFGKALSQLTSGTLKGFADGLVNLYNVIVGNGRMDGIAGLGMKISQAKEAIGQVSEVANTASDAVKAGSDASKAIGKGTDAVAKAASNATDAIAGGLEASGNVWGMIVGAILELLDALGEDPGGTIGAIIDKVFDVIEGILEQIGNGQFLGQIVRAIVEGIGHLIEQILENIVNDTVRAFSFDGPIGGLSDSLLGIFGLGSKEESYEDAKERYEQLSDVWDELISKKKQYLSESWGTEAIDASEEALRLLRSEREANRILAEQRLGAGSSMGSHSYGYRMWKGSYTSRGQDNLGLTNSGILAKYVGEINWKDVNQAVRRGLINAGLGNVAFNSMEDLLKMNADQLNWIKENYTGLWAAMDSDFREYLENVITFGETEEEIMKQLQEQITGTSFDSVFDSFMNSLNDLADGSEDVFDDIAEDFQKMMNKMVLNNLLSAKYKAQLKQWYDMWEQAYSGDQRIDADELSNLKEKYNAIMKSAADEVEALRENGLVSAIESSGKNKDKSATYSAAEKVTYDQMDEFTGILVAVQIAGEQRLDVQREILYTLQTMTGITAPDNADVREIRNMLGTTNDYLLDIKRSNREILDSMVLQFEKVITSLTNI